jgi:hypothetical protein
MTPKPGKQADVAAMMDELVTLYKQHDGFIDGYKLRAADETGDIGRVTVWRSQEDADRTAQSHDVMSRRSDLMPLIEEGSHHERSFFAEEASKPLSQLLQTLGL